MPIYEFYCPKNNKIYSFLARSLAYADKVPRCPDNSTFPMERVVSSFAVTGRATEENRRAEGASGFPDIDDAKMEAAMAQMEREFSGMDEENPDPKALARMMRKMTSLTGEKMPETMDEMISRMEKGEDPEKLEEEYGDALEDFDPMSGKSAEAGEETDGGLKAQRRRNRAQRDPQLYEFAEFVD